MHESSQSRPLTILLVPPAGDTALIEGGVCRSRPPLMFRRHGPYSDDDRRLGLDRWSPLGDRASDVDCALVLVYEGVAVAAGCDRATRWVHAKSGGYSPTIGPRVEQEWTVARAEYPASYAELLGARVVLLRDGLEVES